MKFEQHIGLGSLEVSMNTKCYWFTFLCLAPQHAVSSQKAPEDLPMIRRADLENHNRDGGLWIVVDRKVYDVQDFRYVPPLKKFNLHVLMSCLHCNIVISFSAFSSGGSRLQPGILVENKLFWFFSQLYRASWYYQVSLFIQQMHNYIALKECHNLH